MLTYYYINRNSNSSNNYYFQYQIEIIPTTNNVYCLFLPIPINDENLSSLILQNIKHNYKDTMYTIINTSKGLALNISSNSKVRIESKLKFQSNPDYQLSLRENSSQIKKYYNGNYWIFSDFQTPNTISVTVITECQGWVSFYSELYGNIHENGWGLIAGEEYRIQS